MTEDKRFEYHGYLDKIAGVDITEVRAKDVSYGASWKKRGGVGAFFVMARKWDRLEEMVKKHDWNIFAAGEDTSGNDGTLLAEIRDLRRYLLLIEAEILHGKSQS